MTEREIFKKFDKLSEHELNVWNEIEIEMFLLKILSWQILLSIVEVKKKEV